MAATQNMGPQLDFNGLENYTFPQQLLTHLTKQKIDLGEIASVEAKTLTANMSTRVALAEELSRKRQRTEPSAFTSTEGGEWRQRAKHLRSDFSVTASNTRGSEIATAETTQARQESHFREVYTVDHTENISLKGLYRNPEIKEELREWRERFTTADALRKVYEPGDYTIAEFAVGAGCSAHETFIHN